MQLSHLAVLIPLAMAFAPPAVSRFEPPAIALAGEYHNSRHPGRYLISEKLDGVRAYWDGEHLLSRGGIAFHPPSGFTRGFPPEPLDGELWMGRGAYQSLMGIVRDQVPDEAAWAAVRFHVFDAPLAQGDALARQRRLSALVDATDSPVLVQVSQEHIADRAALKQKLDAVVAAGGEGLMLQHRKSAYRVGRHDGLLKLTPRQDAEAVVVGYTDGRGKHLGRLGALVVQSADGRQFRLGSGLSDAERDTPPPLGSVVTYRYSGHTDSGLPRFARYLRVRLED